VLLALSPTPHKTSEEVVFLVNIIDIFHKEKICFAFATNLACGPQPKQDTSFSDRILFQNNFFLEIWFMPGVPNLSLSMYPVSISTGAHVPLKFHR